MEAEVDAETLARRVARDLAEIYGVRPEIAQVQSSTANDGARWAVRVITQGETLARQTGLLDQRRRPVRGLPNRLTTGSRAEVMRPVAWRLPRGGNAQRAGPLGDARGGVPLE